MFSSIQVPHCTKRLLHSPLMHSVELGHASMQCIQPAKQLHLTRIALPKLAQLLQHCTHRYTVHLQHSGWDAHLSILCSDRK